MFIYSYDCFVVSLSCLQYAIIHGLFFKSFLKSTSTFVRVFGASGVLYITRDKCQAFCFNQTVSATRGRAVKDKLEDIDLMN